MCLGHWCTLFLFRSLFNVHSSIVTSILYRTFIMESDHLWFHSYSSSVRFKLVITVIIRYIFSRILLYFRSHCFSIISLLMIILIFVAFIPKDTSISALYCFSFFYFIHALMFPCTCICFVNYFWLQNILVLLPLFFL